MPDINVVLLNGGLLGRGTAVEVEHVVPQRRHYPSMDGSEEHPRSRHANRRVTPDPHVSCAPLHAEARQRDDGRQGDDGGLEAGLGVFGT